MANETVNPAGSPKIEPVDGPDKDDQPDRFLRFEDLTRRLLAVPKAEIDKERSDNK